jgi:hypothetical protein
VNSVFVTSPVIIHLLAAACAQADGPGPTASAFPVEKLPPGYVRGDVASYSYVPIRQWGQAEACGICPYLFEYGLMKWNGDQPLEAFHAENIRRIDLASQWSTCIQLYNRYGTWRDEIINLMIRCHRNRQLIILSAVPGEKKGRDAFENFVDILDRLWESRDKLLTSTDGDKATGGQLINNILAVNIGDEGILAIKTAGIERINSRIKKEVKDRLLDGQRPFAHIRTWYNEVHYGIGAYAANEEDLSKGRQKWPSNSEFVGVDVYHYWDFDHTPFDPDDPRVPRQQVVQHAIAWQNVITRYYGPGFRVVMGDRWDPKNKNDTHAMLQALDLAGADRAMMIFIGNTQYIVGSCYTTPIETMDAFYDSVKAGPWVGLSWWVFDTGGVGGGTLDYLDGTLRHYTRGDKNGKPYTTAELESYRRRFIESRMRMFNDVVYSQFGYLNGPAPSTRNKE